MAGGPDSLEKASALGETSPVLPVFHAPRSHRELTSHDWTSMGTGIALAGGAYPIIVAAVGAVVGIVVVLTMYFTGGISTSEMTESVAVAVITSFAYALAGGALGLVWSGVVAVAVLPLVYLFAWSIRLRGNLMWFGAFCGGLVGFVAVLPLLILFVMEVNEWAAIATALAIGPGLTTIIGQIGGAWGASSPSYDEAIARARVKHSPPALEGSTREEAIEMDGAMSPRFQFGIRHMLWIFIWLSVLLSVIRLSGIPFKFMLPLLGGWLVYQATTLWIGGMLARRLVPWWRSRRRSRST